MMKFANSYGQAATQVLADALLERHEHNASGSQATKVSRDDQ